jgi:tetratricopeptide (TPR) repeat protein
MHLSKGLDCLLCAGMFLLVAGVARGQSEDPAARAQRAKQAMSAGRFEEAAAIYRELVRALPHNPGLRLNLGLALHSAGHFREAIGQFRAVLKQQPNSGPAWLMLGMAHLKLGETAQAIGPLERAVKAEPDNKIARLELADACLALGRAGQAAEHFQKLTELDPSQAKAWQGLGLSYISLSRRAFSKLEEVAPESPYWCVLLARSLELQNKAPSAFYLYRQALAKAPDLRGAHTALARIYEKTGHPDWAKVEDDRERHLPLRDCVSEKLECDFLAGRFTQLVTVTGHSPTAEAYYWQARAYSELASKAFARLSEMPPSAEIHELMAEAYRIQGDHRQSVNEWEEALKLAPGDRHLQKGLARSLWLDREYRAGQPRLEELVRLEPKSSEVNYLYGDTVLELGEPEKAVSFLEKAVRQSPGLLEAHASLARAYLRLGRVKQAIPHLKAALGIDETGSFYYQLARAYEKTGQTALAKQTMQKFEEISRSLRVRRQKFFEERQITPP